MYVSFRFLVWERIFLNSTSEISLSVNAFETILGIELSCISMKVFCFWCLCIFLKRNFSITFRKIEAFTKNTFIPSKTFPEIVPMISLKFDKIPTLKRNIHNWKIKRQPVQKFSKQWYFLSLQSVWVFLHSAPFQFHEFHVVCTNWGSFFIQWNKKLKSTSYKSQPRTGIFFNGESGPKRRP